MFRIALERPRAVHEDLGKVHGILRGVKYPYAHQETRVSVSRFALERMPGSEDVVKVYRAAESTLEALYGLYMRLMSDLAKRAEAAEAEVGLEPLEEVNGENGNAKEG